MGSNQEMKSAGHQQDSARAAKELTHTQLKSTQSRRVNSVHAQVDSVSEWAANREHDFGDLWSSQLEHEASRLKFKRFDSNIRRSDLGTVDREQVLGDRSKRTAYVDLEPSRVNSDLDESTQLHLESTRIANRAIQKICSSLRLNLILGNLRP